MHHLVAIPGHRGSFAMLADSPSAETAVIFVHGFAGDAAKTWLEFQSLIDVYASEYDWWRNYDAFFYQYSSISKPLAVNADEFLTFSSKIFPELHAAILHGIREESSSLPYKNVILVGHSEGAVVIRRALAEAYKMMREVVSDMPKTGDLAAIDLFCDANPMFVATTILYGPAYFGFSGAGWLQVLLRLPKLSGIFDCVLNLSVAYVELQKDSPLLHQLKDETEDIAEAYPYLEAFRAFPIFGVKDRIVYIGEYKRDHPAKLVPEHNHISICKPGLKYRDPLKDVYYGHKHKASGV